MSARISLSLASAETAYGELSVRIHITKERLAATTDPQSRAILEALLPSITAARDELGQQMWPASFGKRAAA